MLSDYLLSLLKIPGIFLASAALISDNILVGKNDNENKREGMKMENIGLNLISDAIANGTDNMTTILYGGAVIVALLAAKMFAVSLNNAGRRARFGRRN